MQIGMIGAPLDLGADRRGVDMGASAIRYAGLEPQLQALGHVVKDFGNVSAPVPESTSSGSGHLKYLDPILAVTGDLATRVAEMVHNDWLPLILGGDHSVSLGSVAGVAQHRKIGVVWIDAHGDFNTEQTSPSGNIHGMVLAALAGFGDPRLVNSFGFSPKVAPQNIAMIGVRQLDPGERALLREAGVTVFTMHDIDRIGLPAVVELAVERAGHDVDGLHVSLDLDVIDPLQAPGVGTPVLGGLNYREGHLAMEMLAQSGRILAMDVVEVNPIFDNHNETAVLAMQFVLSALGKRIM